MWYEKSIEVVYVPLFSEMVWEKWYTIPLLRKVVVWYTTFLIPLSETFWHFWGSPLNFPYTTFWEEWYIIPIAIPHPKSKSCVLSLFKAHLVNRKSTKSIKLTCGSNQKNCPSFSYFNSSCPYRLYLWPQDRLSPTKTWRWWFKIQHLRFVMTHRTQSHNILVLNSAANLIQVHFTISCIVSANPTHVFN